MYAFGHDRCRLSSVLTFGGDPSGLAGLRSTVREQLRAWGLPDLADLAQLAVTELASNVIKHVGEGAPATLVMAFDDNCLNLELHDTSSLLPVLQTALPDEESGRGLALLAAISANWGSIPTATGKAVWCRLTADPTAAKTTRRRIQRATLALQTYGRESGTAALALHNTPVREELVTDLITDVLHWLAAEGIDPENILDRAQTHYEAEL